MIAKMAGSSQKPDGLVKVEQGSEESFVRDLPVENLPGVGRSRLKVLRKLNVKTIGDLRALDRQSLQVLFGADGLALHERCRGRDSRVIDESEIPQSISRATSFHEPTSDATEIEGMLYYLLERATRAMRRLGLKCGTVGVHIRYSDSGGQQSSRTLPSATSLDKELFGTARERLWKLYTRRASLHGIGVRLSNFSAGGQLQGQLFDRQDPDKLARLYSCLDRLRQKFGHSVIVAGKSFEAGKKLDGDRYGYRLRTPSLTK
jgi:DNA polymerase-4